MSERDATGRITRSTEETERLGEALGSLLEPGDLVVLSGPLGAGKTRLVAGMARGVGSHDRVRSPTFTILTEYRGCVTLFHADLYRLVTADVAPLGLEECLDRGAVVVEWGEKLPASMLRDALRLDLVIRSDTERSIAVTAETDARSSGLLERWRARGTSGARA